MSRNDTLWCRLTPDGSLKMGGHPGNYQAKIEAAIASGKILIRPGEVQDVQVAHDDWCGSFQGKPCNCDPEIRVNGIIVEAEE